MIAGIAMIAWIAALTLGALNLVRGYVNQTYLIPLRNRLDD